MNEPFAIVTLFVLGVTAYTSWQGFNSESFLAKFIFSSVEVHRYKQYYRLISSGFLHADWTHFIFNAFSLYAFGSHIELNFGAPVFLAIYFSSILGGSLFSLYMHRGHQYHALGASGGVCGVIFSAIFLVPGGSVIIFPIPIGIPSWLYAIVFILVSYKGMRSQKGNIGHDAHLGGALVGLAVTTLLFPAIVTQSPLLYLAVLVISGALIAYEYKRPL
ncbi:MAG: rhomboid family intramembrane serine protease [Verrucomicrobia bacterium]|nr:rhomboid family intramembrane serine protease [Verrucomicrobiota bacterium]